MASWHGFSKRRGRRCPSGSSGIVPMEWTVCWKAIGRAGHRNLRNSSNNSWEIFWTAVRWLTVLITASGRHR